MFRHIKAPHDFECKKCDKKFVTVAFLRKHLPVCPNKHLPSDDSDDEKEKVKPGKRRRGIKGKGKKEESDDEEKGTAKKRKSVGKTKFGSLKESSVQTEKGKKRVNVGKTPVKSRKNAGKINRQESTESVESILEEGEESEEDVSFPMIGKGSSGKDSEGISDKKRKSGRVKKQESADIEDSNESVNAEEEKQKSKKLKQLSDDDDSADDINLSERLNKNKTLSPKKNKLPEKTNQDLKNDEEENEEDEESTIVKEPSKEAICDLCGLVFPKATVKRHRARLHKCPCKICDKIFISKPKLNIHMKSHENKTSDDFECEVCGITLSKLGGKVQTKLIAEHISLEHRFGCTSCPKKFTSAERLNVHAWGSHQAELNKEFQCSYCQTEFTNKDGSTRILEFEEHIFTNHKVDCKKGGIRVTEDENHVFSSVELPSEEALEHIDPICNKCGIEFESQNLIRSHSKLPHPFDCSDCDLHFISEPRLRFHTIISHEAEDQIKTDCTVCGGRFTEIPEYLQHWETPHSQPCEKCELKFIDVSSLNKHERTAHPIVLVCVECKLDFTGEPDEYSDHTELIHKIHCYICELKFVKSLHLKKHIQSEHKDEELKCKMCEQSFGDFWQQLEAHLKEPHR